MQVVCLRLAPGQGTDRAQPAHQRAGTRFALFQPMQARCNRNYPQADHDGEEKATRLANLDRDVVAPEDPDAGPLGAAVRGGDYRTFRVALSPYEEWLRNRVGRWLQRYPEAEARLGRDLTIGDLVE